MTVAPILDLQPTLEGPNVLIRPLRAEDYDGLFAVAGDALLWAQHPASDRYQEPVFRRLFEESLRSGGAVVVIDRRTGAIIGSSRYHAPDPASRRVEIGWSYLARSHWGGVTNAEVKNLLLRHAFGFADVVYFRVAATNTRSRRAMEKIGGVLSAQTVIVPLPNGEPILHVIYEIRRPAD
jgi:RimJ/RimL family protein N-acetyltransferase